MEEREGERKQRWNKREGKEKTRKELMKIRSSRIMNEREMNGKNVEEEKWLENTTFGIGRREDRR